MSLKILVVDDASFTRDLIKRSVRKSFPGTTVEEAVNGRKAQQLLQKIQFDMVLCDWEMPEMTGVELLKWCREQPQYAKEAVPFVMITSRGDKSHVVEAVQSGVTDYLGKPFSAEQLNQKIISAAKKHGIEKKLSAGANGKAAAKTAPSSGGVATASLDVLMGGASKAPKNSSPKIVNPTAPTPDVAIKDVKIPTLVRFEGKQFRCMVVKFSKNEATVLIKSDDVIPQVLGQAVLDLEFDKKVNRLNYFIQSVATTDKKHDSAFLTVTLGLIDQDAEKEAFVKALFESL
ncbi:response regulator [Marinomonas mediterranea]|jgi:Response regulator containing CheY-like receiver, AAA-type ATPase, and DNA-binding domains|uniref:Response regulator receiver protein n=1 Tax=Marinomonas mediterranea (strain ATCC 700492 / JCM 21426 / NBRC 103028 / MMB-1) TaxID=717774 RepID=F2K0Z5_MARM1|nr:response regulator [Marinomonas mediterranea]ADZ93344.1 response regulator receiver protein [Marinomonas mediterranea MMB-1]WCN11233.1 response regulator [Marinomonas mediterranea]WCN19340.1 response regulator [Marinomonas mediterranea MMB-1]